MFPDVSFNFSELKLSPKKKPQIEITLKICGPGAICFELVPQIQKLGWSMDV
jgi:hypothetical protein